MNRFTSIVLLLFLAQVGIAQDNCGCNGIDMSWLEVVKNNITEEILNPPFPPCGSSEGSITQCHYMGQTVFVYVPTILPCDVATRVVDCNGEIVFTFGGFCDGPCPGDDQVQFLEACEVIYSVSNLSICDNSCAGSEDVVLEVGCLIAEAGTTNVCLPITTRNFTNILSVQGGIQWDPDVITYTGVINEIGLTGITVNDINATNGNLLFLWLLGFGLPPVDLPDNLALFEICFDIIGPLGSMTSIDLIDQDNLDLEVANSTGELEPLCIESGKISVGPVEDNSLQIIFCDETPLESTCVNLSCDTNNLEWLEELKTNLLDPDLNPSIGPCVPTQTISQCDYNGQTVIVQSPGLCLVADEPSTVYDCDGNFLFQFGGFCITIDGSPCPGDIEAQFISGCEVIFSVQEGDTPICEDNAIPTLGEWALISLSLLFMIFGINSIRERQNILQSAN